MTLAIITAVLCFFQLLIAAPAAAVISSDVDYCKEFEQPRRNSYDTPSGVTLAPTEPTDLCNKVRAQFTSVDDDNDNDDDEWICKARHK